MNEILQNYRDGKITLAECWNELRAIRKSKPKGEPEISPPVVKESLVYLPCNDMEIKAIERLQSVHFGMSRGAKRFVSQIKDKKELTKRQSEYLRLLVWKYRRQLWRKDYDVRAKAWMQGMMHP